MSPLKIVNPSLYADRTVQDWHRSTFGPQDDAIDLDLFGACHRCREPLYLIEGSTFARKPTTILVSLARRANVPAFLVLHNRTTVVGGEQKWPVPRRYSVDELALAFRALRSVHECRKAA